jgi:hypothetical protein
MSPRSRISSKITKATRLQGFSGPKRTNFPQMLEKILKDDFIFFLDEGQKGNFFMMSPDTASILNLYHRHVRAIINSTDLSKEISRIFVDINTEGTIYEVAKQQIPHVVIVGEEQVEAALIALGKKYTRPAAVPEEVAKALSASEQAVLTELFAVEAIEGHSTRIRKKDNKIIITITIKPEPLI